MASRRAPPAGGGGGGKRKRVVLTINQKIDICRRLENGENKHVLMRKYNVGDSTIYDIKAKKEKFLQYYANTEKGRLVDRRCTLRKPKLHQLDSVLYKWFVLQRSEGAWISKPILIEKAKEYYEKMGLTEPCGFSDGWLMRFRRRHGIKRFNPPGEERSAGAEAARSVTDEEIIESVVNPEKGKGAAEDSEVETAEVLENGTAGGDSEDEATEDSEEETTEEDSEGDAAEDLEGVDAEAERRKWKSAASAFTTLLRFAEQQPCYSPQEAMQLYILHHIFKRKWQKLKRRLLKLRSEDNPGGKGQGPDSFHHRPAPLSHPPRLAGPFLQLPLQGEDAGFPQVEYQENPPPCDLPASPPSLPPAPRLLSNPTSTPSIPSPHPPSQKPSPPLSPPHAP